MSFRTVGRVNQTTTTTGTGPFSLSGAAPAGRLNFADRLNDGDEVPVTMESTVAAEWQTGKARFNTGPARLTWTEVYDGSAGLGVTVTFSAGLKQVYADFADKLINQTFKYVHAQAVPASTWTIAHNLNCYPSVRVVDSAGTVVLPDVDYLDPDTVRLRFNSGFSGTAYIN